MTPSDLKLFQASAMPVDANNPSPMGGGISAIETTGATIGEVFFTMPADGGSDKTQYSKLFYKNDHGSEDLNSAFIYVANLLNPGPSGNHLISLQGASVADGSTKKARVIGYDSGGNPAFEDIALDGTALVVGGSQFSAVHAVELRLVAGSALTPASGNITVKKDGTDLGIIPAGYYSATAEVEISLVGSLDDTDDTGDPSAEPSGVSWSRPRSLAEGLAVANGGTLISQSAQGIWLRWIEPAGRLSSADIELAIGISGVV